MPRPIYQCPKCGCLHFNRDESPDQFMECPECQDDTPRTLQETAPHRVCLAALMQGALMAAPTPTENGWDFSVDPERVCLGMISYNADTDTLAGWDEHGGLEWEHRVELVLLSYGRN